MKYVRAFPSLILVDSKQARMSETIFFNKKSFCFVLFLKFLLLFSYSCPHFPLLLFPVLLTRTSHIQPPTCLCPWVLYTCSLTWPFPFFPLLFPSPSHLVTVSLFFISMSVYFAHLSVLWIRFHLYMRSYGNCLWLPGLFHLD